jgi:BirA family biotin operon repressor/biotin-[acetyl-CoA-carboxylase] ligase
MSAAESGAGPREPRLPPVYRLVALDSVPSTMDEARRLAQEGAEDGTLVWAREQTGGRGRRGRGWTSPRGNLYLTLILRPMCPADAAAQLGFVAGLGLVDALGSVVPPLIEVHLKWPNDLLLNDRKAAGLLLELATTPEGEVDFLLLGLGCNVKSFPEDTEFPATSIHFEGAQPSLCEVDVLDAFGRHFLTWVNRWLEDGFAPIRQAWLRHAWRLGEEIEVRADGEALKGTFKDVDDDGGLQLVLPDGEEKRISAGDVFFRGS